MIFGRLRVIILKSCSRVNAIRKRIWQYLDLEHLAMRGYEPFADADSFHLKVSTMLGHYTGSILDGIEEKERSVIINAAEQSLLHQFDLLGAGVVKSDPIDWQSDLKSGKRWEKQYYCSIKHISGADIKMPWELSRCQHFLWLGEAYLLTGEGRYAQEVIDELLWWIDDNPLMYTVNWKCPMDVAIRAVNWIFALNMISGYEGFDSSFTSRVSCSLWQHGFYLINNLERVFPDSNNHYIADLVGLLYIGVLFNHTKSGKRWLTQAYRELISEVHHQVFSSGIHYERSVSYHRMVTELFSFPVYMLERMGLSIPQEVFDLLRRMYSFVSTYTKPNGLAPLIADNDDGRFAPFLRRDFRQHDYLNTFGSVENKMISVGLKPLFCATSSGSHVYSDAGFAIVREDSNYLFVNNGGFSKHPKDDQTFIGTHTHNDLLSFELALNGRDIVVDAGTYLYTSSRKDRDAFRSTTKHNTIVVDGEEQNEFVDTFYVRRNVKSGGIRKLDSGLIEGYYTTIRGQLHHHRFFGLSKSQLVITDKLKKEGTGHLATIYLHFAEGVVPILDGDKVLLDKEIEIAFSNPPEKVFIFEDTLSPSYGVLVPSKSLEITYTFDNDLTVITTFSNKKNK